MGCLVTEFQRSRWGIWKQGEALSAANLDRKPKDFQAPLHQRVTATTDEADGSISVCNPCDCCPDAVEGYQVYLSREKNCGALGFRNLTDEVSPGVWQSDVVDCPAGGSGRFTLTVATGTLTTPGGATYSGTFNAYCGNRLDLQGGTRDNAPCVCVAPLTCKDRFGCPEVCNPLPSSFEMTGGNPAWTGASVDLTGTVLVSEADDGRWASVEQCQPRVPFVVGFPNMQDCHQLHLTATCGAGAIAWNLHLQVRTIDGPGGGTPIIYRASTLTTDETQCPITSLTFELFRIETSTGNNLCPGASATLCTPPFIILEAR